jgi:hypothetical protein
MVVQMAVGVAVPTEMVAVALVVVAIVAAEIVDMSLGVVVGHMVRTVVAVRSVGVAHTIVAEAVMVAEEELDRGCVRGAAHL